MRLWEYYNLPSYLKSSTKKTALIFLKVMLMKKLHIVLFLYEKLIYYGQFFFFVGGKSMRENVVITNSFGNYIFTSKQIAKYDMVRTKENVEELVSEYKQAKFWFFASEKVLKNINSYYEPKYNQHTANANDKIGVSVPIKLDADKFIVDYERIIDPLLETLSEEEKKYYSYCLSNELSEQILADNLGVSRTGLQPIKNNCILKIGLAFQIAIRK